MTAAKRAAATAVRRPLDDDAPAQPPETGLARVPADAPPEVVRDLTYEPFATTTPRSPGVPAVKAPTTEPAVDQWARNETYTGLSERPVSPEQAAALLEAVRDDELLIKPDRFGAVYLSHPGYRRRLNRAFSPAGWGLRRISPFNFDTKDGMLYAEYALYAEGRFLAAATGEQKYLGADGTNDQMTKGDAIEGCRSNALMRCCKDLGMAMECWDRDFTDRWRATHCFRVWRDGKPAWRRMTDPPMYKESGVMDDSPNKEKYALPSVARDTRGGSSQPSPSAPGGSPGNGRAPYTGKGNPDAKINAKQKSFFWLQVKTLGLDPDDVAAYLKDRHKIARSEDMTNAIMDAALAWCREGGD